jgi:hypothetical protein
MRADKPRPEPVETAWHQLDGNPLFAAIVHIFFQAEQNPHCGAEECYRRSAAIAPAIIDDSIHKDFGRW